MQIAFLRIIDQWVSQNFGRFVIQPLPIFIPVNRSNLERIATWYVHIQPYALCTDTYYTLCKSRMFVSNIVERYHPTNITQLDTTICNISRPPVKQIARQDTVSRVDGPSKRKPLLLKLCLPKYLTGIHKLDSSFNSSLSKFVALLLKKISNHL